jgi:hypothetical protein
MPGAVVGDYAVMLSAKGRLMDGMSRPDWWLVDQHSKTRQQTPSRGDPTADAFASPATPMICKKKSSAIYFMVDVDYQKDWTRSKR